MIKLNHSDSLGIFLIDKKSNEEKFIKEIDKVIETKPKLTSEEIKKLIHKIRVYYEENPINNKEEKNYFDKIIEIYDKNLIEEDKFTVLKTINIETSFEKYANNYLELFKSYFQKNIFIYPNEFDLDGLFDYQMALDYYYGKGRYKASWGSFSNNILLLIYKYFYKEFQFFDLPNRFTKYNLNCLKSFEYNQLLEMLSIAEENDIMKDEFYIVIEFIFNRYDLSSAKYKELSNNLIRIKDRVLPWLNTVYTLKIGKLNIIFDYYLNNLNYIYYNSITNLGNETNKISSNMNSIFSFDYIKSLNILEKLSSKERKNNKLYLKCFKIFLESFLLNFNEKLEKKDLNMIESLFQRAINNKNIFTILEINNRKTLLHYYKTNELIEKILISYEELEKYNAKQYLGLHKYYNKVLKNENVIKLYKFDNKSLILIQSLNLFGYDITKKIIEKCPERLEEIYKILDKKSYSYIQKCITILFDSLQFLNTKKEYSYNSFFDSFDILYNQSPNNVTAKKIKKCMVSINHILFPNNYHIGPYLDKLNLVAKGNIIEEKVEGIKLYNDYRFRILSSIPDVEGSIESCNYTMVDMHSPEILSNGIGKYLLPNNLKASSCLTPNGKASSCLRHGAVSPNGRFFKITYKEKIVAYSWVWRCGEVLCFDNIEVTDDLLKIPNYENLLYKTYKEASKNIIEITRKKEKEGIKLAVIGRGKIDFENEIIDNLKDVSTYANHLFKPNSMDNLYLKDSSNKQVIISGEYHSDINTNDVEPSYRYKRKEIQKFSDFSEKELTQKINRIYFDYCLENNRKYIKIRHEYKKGYINEDWFVGIKEDSTFDFYYCGKDNRLFSEFERVTGENKCIKSSSINLIHPETEQISRVLDSKNIIVNYENIIAYLKEDMNKDFILRHDDYIHNPGNLNNLSKIFEQHAITSSYFGNHNGGTGCNGPHFISVAKVNTDAYDSYVGTGALILSDDICAFKNKRQTCFSFNFTKSAYQYRQTNYDGEYQVLNKICLDKAKGIFISKNNIIPLIQIVNMEDLFGYDLPIVVFENLKEVDKGIIKKYSKIKYK